MAGRQTRQAGRQHTSDGRSSAQSELPATDRSFAVAAPRASKALARFTVLDLTRVRAGPTCVRQLADWGANVIKVEAPPDSEEPMGGPRDNSDFMNLHRNKRSIIINLKSPRGLA